MTQKLEILLRCRARCPWKRSLIKPAHPCANMQVFYTDCQQPQLRAKNALETDPNIAATRSFVRGPAIVIEALVGGKSTPSRLYDSSRWRQVGRIYDGNLTIRKRIS